MSRTRIKICGLREVEHAQVAAGAGAWAVGLVFVKASPRFVEIEQARRVVQNLPAHVVPVGLFVNETAQRIGEVAMAVGLHTVQLHGNETPELVKQIAPLRVIKVAAPDDLNRWQNIANLEAIMFDAPPEVSRGKSALPGGGGRTFDWSTVKASNFRGRFILAGGLTPENVGNAIATIHPWAVDVSSGVESTRGVKDPGKIRAFCEAVRDADKRGAP